MSGHSIGRALGLAMYFLMAGVAADERVDSALDLELQHAGSARVTILFDAGDPADGTATGRADRQQQIRILADQIISTAGSGFELNRRFTLVSAVVGTLDRTTLDRVLSLPSVRAVGLDPSGSGHLDVARELLGINIIQAAPPKGLGIIGQNVKVVVMDSGIDSDSVDFGGVLLDEACFCSDSGAGCCPGGGTTQLGLGAAEDDHGHGTWVSGHVLSQGLDGPLGAAPAADLVAVKVLDSNNAFCCASDVTAAYDWIATNHPDADVLNASLGTNARFAAECSDDAAFLIAMAQATAAVRANGTLMTASSGNNLDINGLVAPSCLADVMAVGATYKQNYSVGCAFPQAGSMVDDVACFSNASPELEILAPGAFMNTTDLGGGTITGIAGTSFASPLVAGCAALVKAAMPALTDDAIRSLLIKSGVPVQDDRNGETYPRLDCLRAVLDTDVVFRDEFELN
ncbi:MAG: S8 family serine peptidase [Pseudomonadota bacterium]